MYKMSDSRILSYLEKLGYSYDNAMKVINSANRKYVEEQLVKMEFYIRFIKSDNQIDPMQVLFAENQPVEVEVLSGKTR